MARQARSTCGSVSSDGGESSATRRRSAPTSRPSISSRRGSSAATPCPRSSPIMRTASTWRGRTRGYAAAPGPTATVTPNNDARIVMTVSSNRGQHVRADVRNRSRTRRAATRLMPSLAFAAGRIQAICYDAREDASGIFGDFIDDKKSSEAASHDRRARRAGHRRRRSPCSCRPTEVSLEISKYREVERRDQGPRRHGDRSPVDRDRRNPPNLPMYANGIDAVHRRLHRRVGLAVVPDADRHGAGVAAEHRPAQSDGRRGRSLSTSGFPDAAIFHATWTDNRDVRVTRSAGIARPARWSASATPTSTRRDHAGPVVGSPGNTKPFGYRLDPGRRRPTSRS